MSRVIGYVRVSTQRQADKGLSLESQQEKIHAFATTHGIAVDDVSIHLDSGISGTAKARNKRVALDAALAELQAGDYLVAYSLSRLARSAKHLIEIAAICKERGAHIVTLTDNIDTSTASGRLFFTIMAGIAEFESEVNSERVRATTDIKRDKGEKTGGVAPFGYRDVTNDAGKKILVADIGEQAVIAIARDLRNAGLSYERIAKELTKRGIVNRKGNAIYAMAVHRMLKAG